VTLADALVAIEAEAQLAHARYGNFTSSHEGYGVLAEEVKELLDAIQDNSIDDVRHEAMQVAAVAARIVACCSCSSFRERSGFQEPSIGG
jgi:NTP pyrophosphatase (non-canonical NTP hydrolase)